MGSSRRPPSPASSTAPPPRRRRPATPVRALRNPPRRHSAPDAQGGGAGGPRARLTPLILSDAVEGESREVAKAMAAMARHAAPHGEPALPPCVLLSGGETTVTVEGRGLGGPTPPSPWGWPWRWTAPPESGPWPPIPTAATGLPGPGDSMIAGARVTPDSLARARARGLDPQAAPGRRQLTSFLSCPRRRLAPDRHTPTSTIFAPSWSFPRPIRNNISRKWRFRGCGKKKFIPPARLGVVYGNQSK